MMGTGRLELPVPHPEWQLMRKQFEAATEVSVSLAPKREAYVILILQATPVYCLSCMTVCSEGNCCPQLYTVPLDIYTQCARPLYSFMPCFDRPTISSVGSGGFPVKKRAELRSHIRLR